MTHDNLSALRGEYPTLPLDVWAHRTAARDVVGDVGMGVESPEVLARIVGGSDPHVLEATSLAVAHAMRASRLTIGAASQRRSFTDA